MSAKQLFYILLSLIVLLIAAVPAGVFYGSSLLESTAAKLDTLKLENRTLDAQHASIAHARQDIAKYRELDTIARVIVPQDKDQARTVRQLIEYTKATGITVGSIDFPSSNLGQTKNASVPSQATPVPDITGLFQLPITLQSDTRKPISFTQLTNFLKLLENNRRTAQVSRLIITPNDSTGKNLSFEVVLNVYSKP